VPDEHFDEPTPGGVAASVVASAAGAATGMVFAGPPGAMAGAALAPALQALINYLGSRFERARRKAARVLAEAAARNEVTEDELIEVAERSSQKTELVAEAVLAAARATTEEKLDALAISLADGIAGDDYAAAQERLVVEALSDLEPIHIDVMTCLVTKPPMYESDDEWREAMRDRPRGAYGWLPSEVTIEIQQAAPVIEPILATLERHGLVLDTAVGTLGYRARYAVSDFGVRCLDLLMRRHDYGASPAS
jgi:hypothetical protein